MRPDTDRIRPEPRPADLRWADYREAVAEQIDDARQMDWIEYRLKEVCDVKRD